MMKFLRTLFAITLAFVFTFCGNKSNTSQLLEQSHGKSAKPNYSIVFPNDKVNRIDITIDKKEWAKMNEDLETNLKSTHERPGPPPAGLKEDQEKMSSRKSPENRPHRGDKEMGFARGPRIANDSIRHSGKEGGRRMAPPPGGHPVGLKHGEVALEPVWGYCDVSFNNRLWSKVGIRFKGNSSLTNTYEIGLKKFSFKLDFDQFEDEFPEIKNQRFYGFKQLNLKNNFNDASFIREKVSSDLFADFGVVSSKTSFCQVFLDYGEGPQYFGLYTLVEEIDDTLIETQFESEDENLYKPEGGASTFAEGTFDIAEMNKKDKNKDYNDVQQLNKILNSNARTKNYENWKLQLADVFDVPAFIKWLAANTVMQNWDTYGNSTHNYYLYHNSQSGKLQWIPWDNNEALQNGKMGGALSLSLNEVNESWPLIRYVLDDKEWKNEYKKQVAIFSNDYFNPEEMNQVYNKYKELLENCVIGEQGEKPQFTFLRNDAEFPEAIELLKQHVNSRKTAVQNYLEEDYSLSLN